MIFRKPNIRILLVLLVIISACKKDEKIVDSDPDIVIGNEYAERMFFDINFICNNAFYNPSTISPATVAIDSISIPHTLTIDFGTNYTYYGIILKEIQGKIIVNYTNSYFDIGSVHSFSFIDFYISGDHLTGSKTITNNGYNDSGFLTYSVIDSGEVIDLYNQTNTKIQSNLTYEFISGSDTPNQFDDIFQITGSTAGNYTNQKYSSGIDYTSYITTPLARRLSDPDIYSGAVALQPTNIALRKLDFYDGHFRVYMTINGIKYNVALKNY